MSTLKQRLGRLERQMGTCQEPLEITDEARAQATLKLAAWRAEQEAAIAAWNVQVPEDRSYIGHVELT